MQFVCRLGTPDGRVLREMREARNEKSLRSDLEGKGYRIFDLRRRGLNLALPRLGRRAKPVSDQELLIFNQELAGLLRAGLPLLQSLDLMLERSHKPAFHEMLTQVRDRVKSGEELSEAFAAQGDVLPPLYSSTLMAGERSGELEQVIRRFVRYLQLVMETRKRVISALVYPSVLIVLSIVMVGVMTVYVIPKFKVFYDALSVELPALTRVILGFSLFLRERGVWLLAGGAVGLFFLSRWGSTESGREVLDRLRLKIPLIGSILHRFSISEFGRSLSTLLAGGLPLVPALEVAVGAVGNRHLRSRLEPVVGRVREGSSLFAALEETRVIPDLAVDMVRVGESTGALDEMLANVSDFLDGEIETKVQRLLTLVEPIMLVIMGITVSLLLMAMYLPLFSILGQVG